MQLKKNNKITFSLLIILILILSLYTIRKLSKTELDDLHPTITCADKLIKKSDILWIIPLYENISINQYKEWCNNLIALNKTLALHGVYHTYEEFNQKIDNSYMELGIQEFENCFNHKPVLFKPPQLSISEKNKELIKNNQLQIKGKFNQLLHKVYHCSDTGLFTNKFISLF